MNIVKIFMIGMIVLCVGAVFYLMITNWNEDHSLIERRQTQG